MKKITVIDIARMKQEGRKIPVLTAYNFPMARTLDMAGIPILMVGDSLGMAEAGLESTVPVTIDEMIYHTKSVCRGRVNALVVADMPFGSYQASLEDAKRNAVRLVKEGGAEAIKLEGGVRSAEVIRAIVDMDIPVMGHIGLTPQSVHALGGYRVQGKGRIEHEKILEDARAVQSAGAFSIVLEAMPVQLAKEITEMLAIPTIGIGAGVHCNGQVLVLNDMLGMESGLKTPKFVKKYADIRGVVQKAVAEYIKDVESGEFPSKDQSY